MNAPKCPNNAKSKEACERSDLRLIGENDKAFQFFCWTCKLLWSITKPRTKESARWEVQCRNIKQATERERERAARALYSFPSR